MQDYIKESDNLVSLHDQIRDCDSILSQMEMLLSGFQVYQLSYGEPLRPWALLRWQRVCVLLEVLGSIPLNNFWRKNILVVFCSIEHLIVCRNEEDMLIIL